MFDTYYRSMSNESGGELDPFRLRGHDQCLKRRLRLLIADYTNAD